MSRTDWSIPAVALVDSRAEREALLLRLLRLAVLAVVLTFVAWTTTDGDLWGHVKFGHDIVASGAIPTHDPYSFTSDRPWINHEWLSEIAMYGAYAAAGGAGLVVLKVLIVAGMLWFVMAGLRHVGWSPIVHDLLIAVALIGTFSRHHLVRPQLFSLLLFSALLVALTTADRGKPRALLAIPPIFALWVNLHGGFLVGLAVLAVWIAVRLVQTPGRWLILTGLGGAAIAATLLTPYGIGLWWFLRETVGSSRPDILDWRPASQAGLLFALCLTASVVVAIAALWRARGRVDPAALAIVLMLALGTLRINRIDAFFAIAVVVLLGPVFGRTPERTPVRSVPWRLWAAGSAVGILLAAVLLGRDRSCIAVERVPEAEASSVLRKQHGRLLTHFRWGEYAIWHFAPALSVSIDGRRETVYSDTLTDAHFRFYEGTSSALVRRLKPDVIWLPARIPVVSVLEREGWHAAFRGPLSVVLTRDAGSETGDITTRAWTGPRCFPGP